jgi:hypothetical protein
MKKEVFIMVIVFMLFLCGCATLKHTDKDGNVTKYFRVGNQNIGTGSIELPGGGKLNFEGQKSKLPYVKIGADSIEISSEGDGEMTPNE